MLKATGLLYIDFFQEKLYLPVLEVIQICFNQKIAVKRRLVFYLVSFHNYYVNEYEILLIWDDEARVWVAQNDDIPLTLENGSLDLLMERVRLAAPEILELNGREHEDVYLEFITKRRAKVIA